MEGAKGLKLELKTLGFPRFVIFKISQVLNGPEFNVQQCKAQSSMLSFYLRQIQVPAAHLTKQCPPGAAYDGNVRDTHYFYNKILKKERCMAAIYIYYYSKQHI